MWPGQQPPGGEQNPQHNPQQNPQQNPQHNPYQQPGYQQPNPYQQPGYQQPGPGYEQPNPYAQQPQWGAPTPTGAPQPPQGGGGGNRTKWVAIAAATAVVVAAGVTGVLVLGGNDKSDDANGGGKHTPSASASADPTASASGSDDNPRGASTQKPTIAGWKVVVNPKWGIAFDVPPDWEVQSPTLSIAFEDEKSDDFKPLVTMSGTAEYQSKWCTSDDDKDGHSDDTSLGAVGSKGANGAKNTDEVAVNTVAWWVYGGYTQPDKKSLTYDKKAQPYTTASGIKGSIAWAQSTNTPRKGKCASDGKALTFGFKNSAGDFVSWNFFGAKGVSKEIPKATIMKILNTVRLNGDPTGS
ncbi:hypothetical protein [Streptomyces mangrovisoli]|uniref:DUF8017 domain-containing protein n=1 Tax=Streptomyces mangrovisoli TaxID=1428628 RepID=A0A1J4NZM0_9ACTN|nr:hypothetical protein [Streptomyces mangrovisoli]OIJ66924.1 hypothetical protein WN71_016035 [Streptomyces mangrovisoli]